MDSAVLGHIACIPSFTIYLVSGNGGSHSAADAADIGATKQCRVRGVIAAVFVTPTSVSHWTILFCKTFAPHWNSRNQTMHIACHSKTNHCNVAQAFHSHTRVALSCWPFCKTICRFGCKQVMLTATVRNQSTVLHLILILFQPLYTRIQRPAGHQARPKLT